jgi:hypothetical protein
MIIKDVMYVVVRQPLYFFLGIVLITLGACGSDEDPHFSPEEKEAIIFQLAEDLAFQEIDEIVLAALTSENVPEEYIDSRLTSAVVTRSGTFSEGTLTIKFKGTVDRSGNVRNGQIVMEHVGRWNEPGAHWTIYLVGYSINEIAIEGTGKVTVTASTPTTITLDSELIDGKIVFLNGLVATRSNHYVLECEGYGYDLLQKVSVVGDAQGKLRDGSTFQMQINEALVYNCDKSKVFMATGGRYTARHGDRELTIEYGDGKCDNIITATRGAASESFDFFE